MGYVDLLIDDSYGPVSSDQRGALGRVRNSSRILQQAIARMLDASRIDFGHERLSCNEFDLNELLDDVCRELPGAEGVALQRRFDPDIAPLRSDEEKVRTIVRNLVENACRYTERGFVRIEPVEP
jgi:signal transduction histidine kinase